MNPLCVGYGLISACWLVLGANVMGWSIPGTDILIYTGALYSISAMLVTGTALFALSTAAKPIDIITLLAMAGVLGCLYLGHEVGEYHLKALQEGFRWIALGWAFCFTILWFFSIGSEPACKTLFLMLFSLAGFASAIGEWVHKPQATRLGGLIFIICALLSALTSFYEGRWAIRRTERRPPKKSAPIRIKQSVIHFKL